MSYVVHMISYILCLCYHTYNGDYMINNLGMMTEIQWMCCNKIGVKFWGAEKMRLLIPTGKENKKHFRDLVAREQGLEGQGACPQQRQEREFQVEKDTKHRPAHTQHTQELSELQTAQHPHHLTTTHLQPSGTCFRSNSSPEGSSPPATFLPHVLL